MGRLHRAARLGKAEEVAEYLAQGDFVDAVGIRDFTALMIASQGNFVAVVRQLLAAGADPDVAQPKGRTALHFAASQGHLDVMRVLASHGANVNASGKSGRYTPALAAAQSNHPEIVALLRRYDADLSVQDSEGLTAEDWLKRGGIFGETREQPSLSLRRAKPEMEEKFRAKMIEEPSADAYAAKHGRYILVWSVGGDYFADAGLRAWASRITDILSKPALLAECEERFLTGEELEDARKHRMRRDRNRARRERQEERQRLIREGGL